MDRLRKTVVIYPVFFRYLNFGDITSGSQKLQEDQTGLKGHAGCNCVMISSTV